MRAARIAGLLAGAALATSAFCLAASADDITLSREQTIALYMRDMSANYYRRLSDGTYQAYALTWDVLDTPTVTGDGSLYVGGYYGDSSTIAQSYSNLWSSSDYVFVRLIWDYDEYGFAPPAQDNNNYIDIDFNFNLRGITGFYGNVLLTCGNYKRPSNLTAWSFVGRSEYTYNTSVGVIVQNTPVGSAGRPYRILTGLQQTAGLIPDDDKLYMYGSGINMPIIDSATPQDLDSLSIIWRSPCIWGYNDKTDINTMPSFVIAIRTPQIYGYTPPPVTTPAVTTRPPASVMYPQSTRPVETVDLSNLESGVAAIVEQAVFANNTLDWIGDNVYRGVNNLALISSQLDAIYDRMMQAGQIGIDGTLMHDVQNALTSYTTAKIPDDAAAGLTFWAWLMGKITAVSFIGELAAFGAVLAVTYFVLFRGRNS